MEIKFAQTMQGLRKRILFSQHTVGLRTTKQLLRSIVWFPGFDTMAEQEISHCQLSQVATPTSNKDPIQPTELPSGPWRNLVIDFSGPFPN